MSIVNYKIKIPPYWFEERDLVTLPVELYAFCIKLFHVREYLSRYIVIDATFDDVFDCRDVAFVLHETTELVIEKVNKIVDLKDGFLLEWIIQGKTFALCPPYFYYGNDLNNNADEQINVFVYLMRAGDKYKIGVSSEPERRRTELGTSNPDDIDIICTINCGPDRKCALGLEAELHNKFIEKRIAKEWFYLSDNDIVYIKNLAGV